MGLFDLSLPSFGQLGTDISSFFGDPFGSTPVSTTPDLTGGFNFAQFGNPLDSFLSGSGTPDPTANFMPVMSTLPMIGRAGAAVGRSFFNKFPNLAVAMQGLRGAGKNVSRSQLYSLMKRFGPQFLITAGILSAGAISELMMAGPGRRRMNPGNVKALRRAHRRMKSFHHICATNDHLLTHRRRPARRIGSTSQTITAVRA